MTGLRDPTAPIAELARLQRLTRFPLLIERLPPSSPW